MDFKITPNLAEICGIHAGDGYMRKRVNGYELEISGGFDEKEYYDLYVIPLFEKYFGIKIKGQYFNSKGTYGFRCCRKQVCETLHSCGFPFGKKTFTVSVPKQILNSRNLDIIYRFLRGVFDTDGCLSFRKRGGSGYKKIHLLRHTYPRILLNTCSDHLHKGICSLLAQTGIHFNIGLQKKSELREQQYVIAIIGDRNLLLWMFNIGFKNSTKLNRFLIWRKYGFNPPHIKLFEQKSILSDKLDPNKFYNDNLFFCEPDCSDVARNKFSLLNQFG